MSLYIAAGVERFAFVAIAGLALARIRANTLVGAGGCFVCFGPDSSQFLYYFLKKNTGRTIDLLIAEPPLNSLFSSGYVEYVVTNNAAAGRGDI